MINGNPKIQLNDPSILLSQPDGNINLNNVYNNFYAKLKQPGSQFANNHPYLGHVMHGLVSGATMVLNNQYQNQMKKTQRNYMNDPFNLYNTSAMKKYGSYPWLTSTGQFTDFPNEKTPVYEPGYQNSAYLNTMAKAKNGGELFMTFQDGGSTNIFGNQGNLPKYEMGTGSPIQNAIEMDNKHYGLPTAQKGGGFFTPEKLTDNIENYEYYNKPNNFLNYLKDMATNAVVQKALGRKRKGELSDDEMMGRAQMGMGMSGTDFNEFNYKGENPLSPYYTDLYDPNEAKQANAELATGLFHSANQVFSKQIETAKQNQAKAYQQLQTMQNMNTPQARYGGITKYQTTGVTKPTATDAAGFEKWYNETMGKLLSSGASPDDIQAFINMAGNWAGDINVDRNQLQSTAQNPLTYTTQIPHRNSPGYSTYHGQRMTRGDKQDAYQKEYLDILKKFDTDYEVAAANNQIASSKNPNADPTVLRNLEAERDKAIQALENKYPNSPATDQDFFYSKPGSTPAPGVNLTGTTTTPNSGGSGYQFNPAMQQLLGAMAQGYTKVPLFGFRTQRNINALFNQTMADMMLHGQGQGTGVTTGGAGTNSAVTGPMMNTGTWIKDNNINRYDITQNPNKFKMRIRANQPGQGLANVDANGNIINPEKETFLDKIKNLRGNNNGITKRDMRRTQREVQEVNKAIENEHKYKQNPNSYSPVLQEFPNWLAPDESTTPSPGPYINADINSLPPIAVNNPNHINLPGFVTPSSSYPGTQVNTNAANNFMASERAKKISQQWYGSQLPKLGNSSGDIGEYGPIDPDTGKFANSALNQANRSSKMREMLKSFGTPTGEERVTMPNQQLISKPPVQPVNPDMEAAWQDYMLHRDLKQSGGQYQQGGTYYLSDDEIQALIDAGYELE